MARPRVLDIEKGIEVATDLFWRQGYDRTSLADLTAAMGITPPSFYFAFGSKEELFNRVLEHYGATRIRTAEVALAEPTARRVAEELLSRYADLYTEEGYPPGCLAVNSSLPCTGNAGPIREEMARHRAARRERLRNRLQEAIDVGDLPADADSEELARYLMVIGWGMAFDAQAGATREELYRTVARAMRAWPT